MSRMTGAQRVQHLAPNLLIAGVSMFVTWLSFTQEPAQAYLFPRLVSSLMTALALWSLSRAALGMSKVGEGVGLATALNIAPGLILIFVYVFWAAKTLGFYTASSLAFLLLFTIYDPTPVTNIRGWALRIVITAAFMAVMYALFTLLLKVQVPRGLYF